MASVEFGSEHIVIWDFNLHKPSWGGAAIQPDQEADELISCKEESCNETSCSSRHNPMVTPRWSEYHKDDNYHLFAIRKSDIMPNLKVDRLLFGSQIYLNAYQPINSSRKPTDITQLETKGYQKVGNETSDLSHHIYNFTRPGDNTTIGYISWNYSYLHGKSYPGYPRSYSICHALSKYIAWI